MNPLSKYPAVRHYLYLLQWLVTGIQTVLSAYLTFTIGGDNIEDWPQWFLASLAVAPVLWTYLGVTAQTNVPESSLSPADEDPEADDPDETYEDAGGRPYPSFQDPGSEKPYTY